MLPKGDRTDVSEFGNQKIFRHRKPVFRGRNMTDLIRDLPKLWLNENPTSGLRNNDNGIASAAKRAPNRIRRHPRLQRSQRHISIHAVRLAYRQRRRSAFVASPAPDGGAREECRSNGKPRYVLYCAALVLRLPRPSAVPSVELTSRGHPLGFGGRNRRPWQIGAELCGCDFSVRRLLYGHREFSRATARVFSLPDRWLLHAAGFGKLGLRSAMLNGDFKKLSNHEPLITGKPISFNSFFFIHPR